MQSFLSFFFEAVFLTGSAYVSVGFVLGLMRLWYESHPDVVAIQERQKRQMALPAATAPVMSEAMAMQDLRQLETVMLDDEMS